MTILFDPLTELDDNKDAIADARREAIERVRAAKGQPSAAEAALGPPPTQRVPKRLTQAEAARVRKDFRLFVILMWDYLGLPAPTPLQLSMAHYLQHSPDRCILEAFRGAAKTWITAAYVLWRLWCDQQVKITVVSASLTHAVKFVNFTLTVLREWSVIKHLYPNADQRQSNQAFDVKGSKADPQPSVTAHGINGQITGGRADVIIADDVEISTNSLTVTMRDKISEAVKEFDSVLKPGGTIKYLGTPHDEDCLYTKLGPRGYSTRIWPAIYPDKAALGRYGEKIAPFILDQLRKDARLVGHSTEAGRFSDKDLGDRRLSLGDSEFTLQFLLDTSLSDRDKYPLKLATLMVLPLDPARGPIRVTWGMGETKKHLPAMGFGGDYLHGPAEVSTETAPYTTIIAAADISGRGADETAMVVLGELNGMLFALHLFASREGYSPDTLKAMASLCVRFNVMKFYHEGNFGDGMFGALFRVELQKAWAKANELRKPDDRGGTEMVETKSSNQASKERRILSVLEPITQQHRLILGEDLINEDYRLIQAIPGEEIRHKYSLMWQYTHLTRETHSLGNDDRLETLAMACAPFAEAMGIDPVGMAVRAKQDAIEQELEDMFEEADEAAGDGRGSHKPSKSDRLVTKAARPSKR